MTDPRPSQAGGSLLAISIIGGVIAGVIVGEASLGFLAGAAIGASLALALWWRDRGSAPGASRKRPPDPYDAADDLDR